MGRRDDVKPVDAQPVEGVRLLGGTANWRRSSAF